MAIHEISEVFSQITKIWDIYNHFHKKSNRYDPVALFLERRYFKKFLPSTAIASLAKQIDLKLSDLVYAEIILNIETGKKLVIAYAMHIVKGVK